MQPTDEQVAAYQEDGAVCLRSLFDSTWLERVANGVERNVAAPSPLAKFYTPEGNPGSFFGDYCSWTRIDEYRDFVLHSPAAAAVGRLMGARKVNFFHEHLLVKEPGTLEVTPWHHDQPYWCVDGDQVCSLWLPLDPVARESSIEFVAGSHRWGRWFAPRRFVDHKEYDDARAVYESVPDIDAHRSDYRLLSWALEPGDCIVFHGLTLHGAPGNRSNTHRRRAFSTRWTGDDARFARRPTAVSPPFPDLTLAPGDALDSDIFPVVWRDR